MVCNGLTRTIGVLAVAFLEVVAACGRPPAGPSHQCGNGLVEQGESCDDGPANSDVVPDACRTDCTPARCGDSVVDPGEACDGTDLGGASCLTLGYYDGSLTCSGDCSFEITGCAAAGRCGDGVLQGSEQCDDGNENEQNGCEGCEITEFRLHTPEGYGTYNSAVVDYDTVAVSLDATGKARVVWPARSASVSSWSFTIAYQDLVPSGVLVSPGVVMYCDNPWIPVELGFLRPDVVLLTDYRALVVFEECCEEENIDYPLEHPLDGSGTGIFRAVHVYLDDSDPEQVNTFTAGNQTRPRITARWSGESVVVWQSDGQDGSGWGLFAQPFTRDGTALGPEIAVNETTTGDQLAPDVAMLDDGGFMVVWESWDEGQVNQGVFLRRFDEQGLALSGEARIAEAPPLDPGQAAPRITAGPDGLVVVWQAWAEDGDGWGVFGRRFTADGIPETGDVGLSLGWESDQVHPVAAVDGTGSFAAVWEDQSSGTWAVRAGRFDVAGQPLGDEIAVSRTSLLGERRPDIAMTPDGRVVIVWRERWVLAQRFLPDGTPIGLAPW